MRTPTCTFSCKSNPQESHKKDFSHGLILKQRHKETGKWPINNYLRKSVWEREGLNQPCMDWYLFGKLKGAVKNWSAYKLYHVTEVYSAFQLVQFFSVTYQQSPRTPCIMSSGLGLRKTASGIAAALRPPPNDLMCCGRLHSATRGCSEKRGSKYRDFSMGRKESSTNWIFCWMLKTNKTVSL